MCAICNTLVFKHGDKEKSRYEGGRLADVPSKSPQTLLHISGATLWTLPLGLDPAMWPCPLSATGHHCPGFGVTCPNHLPLESIPPAPTPPALPAPVNTHSRDCAKPPPSNLAFLGRVSVPSRGPAELPRTPPLWKLFLPAGLPGGERKQGQPTPPTWPLVNIY